MSVFNKRRKIVRQKQEEDRKRWDESCRKQNESMKNMVKAAEIINEKYPEFKSLDEEERIKLFAKTFDKVNGDD